MSLPLEAARYIDKCKGDSSEYKIFITPTRFIIKRFQYWNETISLPYLDNDELVELLNYLGINAVSDYDYEYD